MMEIHLCEFAQKRVRDYTNWLSWSKDRMMAKLIHEEGVDLLEATHGVVGRVVLVIYVAPLPLRL